METFSALLAICAGNSPVKSPVTWSFDVFFDLRLNQRLSKQSWGWWFETLSRPLWRHYNVLSIFFRVTSLALGQSHDCPSASEATLKNIYIYIYIYIYIKYESIKIDTEKKPEHPSRAIIYNHNKTKHKNPVCIFHGISCIFHSPIPPI